MSELRRRLMMMAHDYTPIHFEDPEVKRICVEKFGGENGIINRIYGVIGIKGIAGEITYRQAAAVKNMSDVFKDNSLITAFEEFEFFVNVSNTFRLFYNSSIARVKIPHTLKVYGTFMFYNCRNLQSITIPTDVTLEDGTWASCLNLKKIVGFEHIKAITVSSWARHFESNALFGVYDISSIKFVNDKLVSLFSPNNAQVSIIFPTKYKILGSAVFNQNSFKGEHLILPEELVIIENHAIRGSAIKYLDIGANLTTIHGYFLYACNGLNWVRCQALTPPTFTNPSYVPQSILNQSKRFRWYVKDEVVEQYRTAVGWDNYADRIFPLSQWEADCDKFGWTKY